MRCSGPCGTRPAWRPAWQAASAAGGPRGAAADGTWTRWSRCSTPPPGSTARLPPGSPRLFLDSLTGQEIAGDTPGRTRPATAMPCASSPRTGPRAWNGTWSWWPACRKASGLTCGMRSSLLGMDELVDAAGEAAAPAAGGAAPAGVRRGGRRARLQAARRGAPAVLRRRHPGTARRWWSPLPGARTARNGRPGSWPSWPGTSIEIEQVAGSGPRWLSLPALTAELRRAAADRRAGRCRSARRPPPSWPGWPRPGSAAPAPAVVRARPSCPTPARSPTGTRPAVAVPGRVVHQVRAALAAGVRRRGQARRTCCAISAS